MKKKITIINGPNLNLTGRREQSLYGVESFETFISKLRTKYDDVVLDYYQSNVEGELINMLHEIGFKQHGIVLNAGGYAHTSVAMGDAVKSISSPCVEVHITNILAREPFRHQSFIAAACVGAIIGFGLKGYELAVDYLRNYESKVSV